MKKYLLLILCLVSSLMASAESGTCGDNLTWSLEDGILVISGTGAMTNYSYSSNAPWYSSRSTISLAIISEDVTSIGNYAFYDCSGLTSITIPNSVTSIGEYAFYGCSGLTSITIPNSVTSIRNYAFSRCYGLTSVNITDVASWCNIDFGDRDASPLYYTHKLFLNGTEIKDLVIPQGVTVVKASAFYQCSGLTSVTIPNSVTRIGDYAFQGCSGLTSITIPNSVTSIGKDAFKACSGLTSVNTTDLASWCNIDFRYNDTNPTYYTHKLFLNGSEIKDLVIPQGVTVVKASAFYNCDGLTSVTIPNSVTSIGNHAFNGCSGLTSVTIPNSVTSIGSSAFSDCSGLTSITIPNSVTSIGNSAFDGCSGLTSVNITDLASWCNIDFGGSYANPTEYAHKLVLNGTEIKDLVIPEGGTEVKNNAFSGCSGLTSINIPNSVTSIGSSAFSFCI